MFKVVKTISIIRWRLLRLKVRSRCWMVFVHGYLFKVELLFNIFPYPRLFNYVLGNNQFLLKHINVSLLSLIDHFIDIQFAAYFLPIHSLFLIEVLNFSLKHFILRLQLLLKLDYLIGRVTWDLFDSLFQLLYLIYHLCFFIEPLQCEVFQNDKFTS